MAFVQQTPSFGTDTEPEKATLFDALELIRISCEPYIHVPNKQIPNHGDLLDFYYALLKHLKPWLKKIYITKKGMTAVFTRGHRLDGRDGNQAAKSGAATLQAFWRQELWGKGKGTLIVGKIEMEVKTNPRPAGLNRDEYDTEEPCHGMHPHCEILPANTTETQPLTCDLPHMLITPVSRRAFVLHDLTALWKYLGTFCSPLYIKLSPSQILIAFPKMQTTTRTRPFTDRKLHFKEINGVKSSYVTDTYVEETTEYGYGDKQLKICRTHLFKAVDESLVEGGMPVEFLPASVRSYATKFEV